MSTTETIHHWKHRLKAWGMMFVATGAYSGYAPFAPGTFGTLVGVALIWLFRDAGPVFRIILCAFLMGLGVYVSHWAGRVFKRADSPRIVIDEIVGFMVTMIGIPITGYWTLWGFVLFRWLDISKLPPANLVDRRFKNGWGVMGDDVISGIYANCLLHLMVRTTL